MNEERFNLDMRKFLKTFGVTAQREIERAVAAGLESGQLAGHPALHVRALLTIEGLPTRHEVEGEISLE
jgi:hypothetical protein